MEMKQHPFSAEKLLAHGWKGVRRDSPRSRFDGCTWWAATHRSAKHPGHVHYEVVDIANAQHIRSIKPIRADMATTALAHVLREHGATVEGLRWIYHATKPHDWEAKKTYFDAPNEFVYFLGAGPFVKIGKTNGRPDARISELQTGCPFPMTLLAHLKGGLRLESSLHSRFRYLRVRENGEWFHNKGELADFIQAQHEVGA